ncbi:MAG: prepilin peptidase [Patescibacteria group bacterium]
MLQVIILVFIFILGLCVGSFLNVLIYRLPHSLPITGRSKCPKCKKKILWYDNIPLLSFAFLRGKCRFCHSPISGYYPVVELLTGCLFISAAIFLPEQNIKYQILNIKYFLVLSYYLVIISTLIVLFFTDLRFQIIPDRVIYPTAAIVLAFSLITNYQLPITNYFLSALGAGSFFLLLHFLTRRKGMGMGDVKLGFLMGLVLGFPKIILALYLAFLTGAFIGVILILGKKKRFGEHIPFGPFLTSATFVSLFWGDEILKWFTARFF